MKNIYFFALKKDILFVLDFVENSHHIKYILTGKFFDLTQQTFLRGSDIPNLGLANNDSSINCETYLVLDEEVLVNPRVINQIDGSQRSTIDQLLNPDSVTFTAAGIFGEEVVLQGRIATASDSKRSQELMKLFSVAFRKNFKKVKAYWIGPDAQLVLDSGKRLTSAVQSPSDFDLIP